MESFFSKHHAESAEGQSKRVNIKKNFSNDDSNAMGSLKINGKAIELLPVEYMFP